MRTLLFGLGLALIVGLGGAALRTAVPAVAQSDDVWAPPVNVSQSGSAVDPALAVDAQGGLHVLWQNPSAGFVYSQGDGQTWSEPLSLRLPFAEPPFFLPGNEDFAGFYAPQWVIDAAGLAHGFWINAERNLLYSRAPLATIADQASWTFPVVLAESATAFDVLIDENGRFHLAYIRPQQTAPFPAGVYYRNSDSGGVEWSAAVSPYYSQYLSAPSDSAHISLAVADGAVFLGWDNRLLDAVFAVRSGDGGATWDEPITMDSRAPEDDPEAVGPSSMQVIAVGETVHLTWRAEHTAGRCTQFHQVSEDGGITWLDAATAVGDATLGCPTAGQFVAANDGLLFLLTTYSGSGFLQVWDGGQWSEPDLQPLLAGFTNPTTYRPVQLGCQQTAVTAGNDLIVVGCGQGIDFDVWSIQRPLGGLDDWSTRFLPTPVWAKPQMVAASSIAFMPPEVVAAGDGRLHAFWSQPSGRELVGDAAQPGRAIFYSRLNAGQWSPARPVIVSPSGKTDQQSVVADADGNLFVVWSGGVSGQVYFSRAVADRASSATEWIDPVPLPSPREAGAWPDIAVDERGTLYVAYAIPLNENRGIYLTQSDDGGDSWSEPALVFDGVASGWPMVGAPKLALTTTGNLHLLWSRQSLPGGIGPQALLYARSEDGGLNWTRAAEAIWQPAVWSELVAVGERELHQTWLAWQDGRLALFYQHSIDDGLTWSVPDSVFSPDAVGGSAILISAADGPHILQLARSVVDGQQMLLEWLWDGAQWRLGEGSVLEQDAIEAEGITAVAAPDGRLGVIFANLFLDEVSGQLQNALFYTERMWDTSAVPTPLPALTATPQPSPTHTPPPQISPTPTIGFSTDVGADEGLQVGPLSVNDDVDRLLLSVIPALIIIIVVFVIGLRAARSN